MHPNVTWLINRAAMRQRLDHDRFGDDETRVEESLEPGGRSDPQYRIKAMLGYAIHRRTKRRWVGYSGTAGGMKREEVDGVPNPMRIRRLSRIGPYVDVDAIKERMGLSEIAEELKPRLICAEPAALSIAISAGANPEDLIFAAFRTERDTDRFLVNPCLRCRTWMAAFAYGYIDKRGNGFRATRDKDQPFAASEEVLDLIR